MSTVTTLHRMRSSRWLLAAFALLACACSSLATSSPASANDDDFITIVSIEPDVAYQLVGNSVKLSAATNYDVFNSPYYLRIVDTTSGAVVNTCGVSTCSGLVTQSQATTHSYSASIASYNGANFQYGASTSVTWREGLVLNASETYTQAGTTVKFLAKAAGTALQSQYIAIVDLTTSQTIATCLASVSCPASVTYGYKT